MVQVEKANIIKVINAIMPGVDSGSVNFEGAENILFKGGRAYSYNGTAAVSTACDIGGLEFCINATDMFKMFSKFTELMVNVEIVEGKLKASAGKTKSSFKLVDGSAIEVAIKKLRIPTEYKTMPEGFAEACTQVAIKGNATPLKGFYIGKFKDDYCMVSTDKIRISCKKLKGAIDEMLIDDDIVKQCFALGTPTKYAIVGAWLHIGFDNGVVFSMVRKDHSSFPADKMFAAVERITAVEDAISFTFPENFKDAVNRVGVLASESAAIKANIVKLTFSNEGIEIFAEKERGDASEMVSWAAPVTLAEPISAWIVADFLLEAVGKAMKVHIKNMNNRLVVVFEGDGFNGILNSATR